MRLRRTWTALRSSLWFTPALLVVGLIALAFALIEVDRWRGDALAARWPRLFKVEPDGAQAMLDAIASSMMTVAGVVFSITIVALAQASTQYSPRVLRNFMRDGANQLVLGSFVGIFAYCLVVLRNVTREREETFVPSVAVMGGFVLALCGVGLLIFFIHHIASSIQASTMIRAIARETMDVIAATFPDRGSQPGGDPDEPADVPAGAWHAVPALTLGYVQRVDLPGLVRLASERRMTLRMEVGVGEFAACDRALVSVHGVAAVDDRLVRAINGRFAIDAYRTVDQDPGFGVRQLVDIAVKALSPGINDTTTAVTAVDYLSQILCSLAGRRFEASRHFADGELRVIARTTGFEHFVTHAFEQIVENAEDDQAVIARLLASLERIAETVTDPDRLRALDVQAQAVEELAVRSVRTRHVRERLEAQAARVRARLARRA